MWSLHTLTKLDACKEFKYNICTCGAKVKIIVFYLTFYLNTTFVHVEPFGSLSTQPDLIFKYNICTCGAF